MIIFCADSSESLYRNIGSSWFIEPKFTFHLYTLSKVYYQSIVLARGF